MSGYDKNSRGDHKSDSELLRRARASAFLDTLKSDQKSYQFNDRREVLRQLKAMEPDGRNFRRRYGVFAMLPGNRNNVFSLYTEGGLALGEIKCECKFFPDAKNIEALTAAISANREAVPLGEDDGFTLYLNAQQHKQLMDFYSARARDSASPSR